MMKRSSWISLAILAVVLGLPLPGAERNSLPKQPVDINTASVEQLQQLPGVGPFRAAMIVRIRERNGPFQSIAEFRVLPRLSEKQFERLRPYLTVGSADDILNSSSHESRHGADPPR